MEKRRRARINASLTELKSLLLEAIKKEGARQNKMEKADILEMAVKHLRHIQRQQFTGESLGELQLSGESSDDSAELSKYQLGFHACVQEVCKYLDWNRDEDVELKTKLLNHLANCMTSADCQTTSTAPSSSSMVSSPSSSSSPYVIHVPISAQSGGQVSTSSSETQSSVCVESSSMLAMSSQSNEISQTDTATREIKPKLHVSSSCSDAVLQRTVQGTTEGILHTVLTSSSTNSVLVKPNMLSLSTSGNLLEARRPEDGRHSSSSHISIASSGTRQGGSVTEINNNSIILPALVNMAAPTTFTCVQQSNQLQQTQVYQQQHQTHLQHQLFPVLPDGSSIFTSSNPLQLIPTKTANGDIAFLLSTTNLVSSSQIPSFSIPVITQPTVSHAPILAPPISQPSIQIALSYPPQDQHQPLTFIANSIQPVMQPVNPSTSLFHSPTPNIPGQTTPLNLSSTTQQGQQATHQLMPKQTVTLPRPDSEHCDDNLPRRTYASPYPVVRQTGVSEADRYSCPPYITKPPQLEHSELKHPTPSISWPIAAPPDPTSLTFIRQAASFNPDARALAPDTDPERSVFNRSEIRLAPDTDAGRTVFNRSEIRLAPDTDAGRSVFNRSEIRLATDTDAGSSVNNRSEIRLADWQSQLPPSNSQSSGSGSYTVSTQGHFFRPWRE